MKTLFINAFAIAAITFSACNGGDASSAANKDTIADTGAKQPEASAAETKSDNPLIDVTTAYLQVKNGLASDNGSDAAAGGKAFNEALGKVDKSSMSADQKQSFDDVADDAKEMAEHIETNAGKIEHQREHFDMLSKDMYDLVKTFGSGRTSIENKEMVKDWATKTTDNLSAN